MPQNIEVKTALSHRFLSTIYRIFRIGYWVLAYSVLGLSHRFAHHYLLRIAYCVFRIAYCVIRKI